MKNKRNGILLLLLAGLLNGILMTGCNPSDLSNGIRQIEEKKAEISENLDEVKDFSSQITGDISDLAERLQKEYFGSTDNNVQTLPESSEFNYSQIPAFTDEPYVVVNNGIPWFTKEDLSADAYESYSDLDSLGRCGVAEAMVGIETMPTEPRGKIGMIKPTGWQYAKYDSVDGKYLYNRCHLLGFQLTGENANEKNLITGTRYMNVDGMLPFENMIDDYIEESGNHVLYRVTPIFIGDELVARGVLMEAQSKEDDGAGIKFNVYCFNNQPGIEINYATGKSHLVGEVEEDTSIPIN